MYIFNKDGKCIEREIIIQRNDFCANSITPDIPPAYLEKLKANIMTGVDIKEKKVEK